MESKNVNAHKRRYHRSPSASAKRHKYHSTDLRPKPYFDTRIDKETGFGARNITTVEGGRAIFICRIRHLGYNNTVSLPLLIAILVLFAYEMFLKVNRFRNFQCSSLVK